MAESEPKSDNKVLKDTVEIVIKHPKKDLKAVLKRPNFEVYKAATVALQTQTPGKVDYLAAGDILMKFCWVEGSPELENGSNSSDPDIVAAYASACVDAYHELYLAFETIVKKLLEHKISNDKISYKQKNALMRFFYKKVPDDIDEYIKLWCEIEYLSDIGIINLQFVKNG